MRYEIAATMPRPVTEAMEDRLADLLYGTDVCFSVSAHAKVMTFSLREEGRDDEAAMQKANKRIRAAWRDAGCGDDILFVTIGAKQIER